MPIPSGVPTIEMVVKNGRGGPQADSIPVYEDLGGERRAWLKTGTKVRIVDPSYPGISKYQKLWSGTTWVHFDVNGKDLVPGEDGWCEKTGHLYEPKPEPEGEWMAYDWKVENGDLYLKPKKI